MKKFRRGVLISFLIVSLTISSPASATTNNSTYSDEKHFCHFLIICLVPFSVKRLMQITMMISILSMIRTTVMRIGILLAIKKSPKKIGRGTLRKSIIQKVKLNPSIYGKNSTVMKMTGKIGTQSGGVGSIDEADT